MSARRGQRPPRAAVRAAVRDCLADLEPGDRVLVALSGGADSLALMAAALRVSADLGLLCSAVVVDHQLQPRSAEVAARAAEQAGILGCDDVSVVAVAVASGPGAGGLEAAARAARYAALLHSAGDESAVGQRSPTGVSGPAQSDDLADGSAHPPSWGADRVRAGAASSARASSHGPSDGGSEDVWALRGGAPSPETPGGVPEGRRRAAAILLGHTRDDQAETVLLALARGSGTRSLAGMAAQSGPFRRPLLDLPRALVAAAAAEEAAHDPRLAPWVDPHNADRAFRRVRVRHDVLPVLADALGPGVVEALARTARLAREDADAVDAWADRVWQARLLRQGTSAPPPRGADVPQRSGRGEGARLPIAQLLSTAPEPLPAAVVSRVVRRFLIAAGCPASQLTAEHVWAVLAMIERPGSGAEVALPGGLRARQEQSDVVVRA